MSRDETHDAGCRWAFRKTFRRSPTPKSASTTPAGTPKTCAGLLGRVLDEVEDLHPELRQAIEQALR